MIGREEKLLIITGGGDWYDASVNAVVVSQDMDVKAELGKMIDSDCYSLSQYLEKENKSRNPTKKELTWADETGYELDE